MIKRFALVAWWIGALLAGLMALTAGAGVVMLPFKPGDAGACLGMSLFFIIPIAACWATAFVLGGSFWRPPRLTD